MTTSADHGARVKKLRLERAWSQEKLAEVAGLGIRTIQRLEGGAGGSPHTLRSVAAAFKIGVEELIASDQSKFDSRPPVEYLPRMEYGGDLFVLFARAHLFRRWNDPPLNDAEVEAIGAFIQELFDASEIWDDIGPKGQVETEHRFTCLLTELDKLGFWVFAKSERGTYRSCADPSPMAVTVATVLLLRRSNPAIIELRTGLKVVAAVLDEDRPGTPPGTQAPERGQRTSTATG